MSRDTKYRSPTKIERILLKLTSKVKQANKRSEKSLNKGIDEAESMLKNLRTNRKKIKDTSI